MCSKDNYLNIMGGSIVTSQSETVFFPPLFFFSFSLFFPLEFWHVIIHLFHLAIVITPLSDIFDTQLPFYVPVLCLLCLHLLIHIWFRERWFGGWFFFLFRKWRKKFLETLAGVVNLVVLASWFDWQHACSIFGFCAESNKYYELFRKL